MTDLQPGNLVFCHSSGIVGKAIRWGEWLRFRPGSYYNHVAILDEPVNGSPGDWWVIQAEARGVTATGKLSDIAPGGSYTIVDLPANTRPQDVLAFATVQIGRRYGWVTIASIVASLIGPKFLDVMAPKTWICSAVAAEALRFGGWYHSWDDIYQVTPAQLYEAVTGLDCPSIRDAKRFPAAEAERWSSNPWADWVVCDYTSIDPRYSGDEPHPISVTCVNPRPA